MKTQTLPQSQQANLTSRNIWHNLPLLLEGQNSHLDYQNPCSHHWLLLILKMIPYYLLAIIKVKKLISSDSGFCIQECHRLQLNFSLFVLQGPMGTRRFVSSPSNRNYISITLSSKLKKLNSVLPSEVALVLLFTSQLSLFSFSSWVKTSRWVLFNVYLLCCISSFTLTLLIIARPSVKRCQGCRFMWDPISSRDGKLLSVAETTVAACSYVCS